MSATTTQYKTDFVTDTSVRSRRSSECSSCVPPAYEMGVLTPTSSISNESLPAYDKISKELGSSSQATFCATKSLQIESAGHPLIALPICLRPTPTPVYSVTPSGQIGELAYESLRTKKHSGNSILVRAGGDSEAPICSTTYRFGPGRPPRLCLHGLRETEEEYEVLNKGCTTRAQTIRTHLGTFEWRYATRQERKIEGADSLLILDLVSTVSIDGKAQERRHKVAQFVRNDEYRTAGSRGSTAGNGGRLMMDLRDWMDTKGEEEQMEVLAVATCIVMLKKEVDRRRMHQAIVLMSASGGP